MSATAASRLARQTARNVTRCFARPTMSRQSRLPILHTGVVNRASIQARCLSTSRISRIGMMPDTEDPQPPQEDASSAGQRATEPTELSDEEYYTISEELMDTINDKAEALQETRADVEVEYSAGVLSITYPPNGTYIINKQPPNKQIWLSSPLSGPKRYDYVLSGESMHQKEGSGKGEWIYLRDGTNLTSLLQKELGLLVDPHEVDSTEGSKDPTE